MRVNFVAIRLVNLCIFVLLSTCSIAQKGKRKVDSETFEWRYEVESAGVGSQGTKQIKVWTYAKDHSAAIEQAKKNAIHAIIFKGIPKTGRDNGLRPLSTETNLEFKKEEFFKSFFQDEGRFQKYVYLVNNGYIAPSDRIKISKKEYKIGVIVSVNVSGLRKYLEDEGVIKSLSSGF